MNTSHIWSGIPLLTVFSSRNSLFTCPLNQVITYRSVSRSHVSYLILIISLFFQELQGLIQLVAKEHEEFVDPIIVNLVPMQVGDVEESLKPLLLPLYAVKFPDLRQELGYLLSELTLVLGLVGVPEIYTAEGKSAKRAHRRRGPPR